MRPDLQPVRGQAAERARLGAVRVHDVEALEAGLQVGEGTAVVEGSDLAAQVRQQHDLMAGRARLRDQVVIGLAGDEGDLILLGVKRQGAAQRHPAGAGHEPGDDLRYPQPAGHDVNSSVFAALSSSRSGAPGRSPRFTCRHGSLTLSSCAMCWTGGWLPPRPVPSASVAANAQ